MTHTLDADTGARATFGLIVLQVDETIEQDARHCLPDDDLALYVSRIPSGADLTTDTISQMESDLPAAAALLPQTPLYDVVGYACTSGTTLIGEGRVAALIRSSCRATHVTNPLTAAQAAFQHLGITSIALVSPYVEEISTPVEAAFISGGVDVKQSISFGEQVEANVARISATSIADAAVAVVGEANAVFLSCTNLRTLKLIPELEERLGKPVISSNTALFWHMARLAGVSAPMQEGGLLLSSQD